MTKRAAKGTGSVYQRANGMWVAKLPPERRADGTKYTPTFYGKTQTVALEKRKAHVTAANRGQLAPRQSRAAGKVTLVAYMTDWVERHPVADETRKGYRQHIRTHIAPWFKDKRLDAITAAMVRDWVAHLGTKPSLSKSSVVRIRATLSKALNCAVVEEKLAFNPARYAQAPKPPPGKRAHHPLREEDIPAFVKVAREHRWWPLWALLLGTGARMGEALALRWSDVSLQAGTVHYRGTKNDTSDRVVPLPDWTLEALRGLQKATDDTGLVFITNATNRWVGGKPYDSRNVNREFHKLLTAAGIEDRRPHDMRHTFATLQLADGTDMPTLQWLLGHVPGSPITMEFYASVGNKAKVAAARRADNWIKKEEEELPGSDITSGPALDSPQG